MAPRPCLPPSTCWTARWSAAAYSGTGIRKFIRFLNVTEAAVPKGKAIHAIVDNYATHKHPKVKEWLARHPRWRFHFTPTSSSWLNAVEGYFAKLTKRRLKRGVFCSVVDLQAAINRFLAEIVTGAKPREPVPVKPAGRGIGQPRRGEEPPARRARRAERRGSSR